MPTFINLLRKASLWKLKSCTKSVLFPFSHSSLLPRPSDPADLPEQWCQGGWSRGDLSSIPALTELSWRIPEPPPPFGVWDILFFAIWSLCVKPSSVAKSILPVQGQAALLALKGFCSFHLPSARHFRESGIFLAEGRSASHIKSSASSPDMLFSKVHCPL